MTFINPYELVMRNWVVAVAQAVFQSGAHYLWGGQGDGHVPMARPESVGNADTDWCLNAASLSGAKEYLCAGRCDNPDARKLPQWKGKTLEEAALAGASQCRWPRYYRDGDTVHPSPSGLVYGESCRDKLHFDCAGFVRFCFRLILGAAIIPVNATMRAQATRVWTVGQGSIGSADVLPADLLYTSDFSHVALATGKSDYNWWSFFPSDYSFHAYYAKVGVVSTPILGGGAGWVPCLPLEQVVGAWRARRASIEA